ncbi:MAG: EAL domain-containing protein [Azoarcus sp.]|nr:EAL domain-containing protein [Azoarcus sp.]
MSTKGPAYPARDNTPARPLAHRPADPTAALQLAYEELRLQQAELEVQNEQLISTQFIAASASARYATVFQALPVPALVLDNRGVIQDANQQAVDFFGFRTAPMLRQHSVFRLLANSDDSRLGQILHHGNDESVHVITNLLISGKNAGPAHMEGHVVRLPAEYHLDGHHLLLLLDRNAEHEKEQGQAMFQAVLDNTQALIYAFDREGQCILANQALLRQVGRTAENVLAHRRDEWLDRRDANEQACNDHQVFVGRTPLTFEETLHLNNGEIRYHVSQKFPLKDPAGGVYAVAGITTDITERKRLERRLQLAMHVFSQGSEGIVVCDGAARITSVNRAFEEITGYTEAQCLGRNPSMLASGRHAPPFYQQLWHELQTHGRWEGEVWNRRKDGTIYPQWLRVSRVSGDSKDDCSFVGVFSDISTRKASEEEIERLAYYDLLTGTPNRHLLRDRLEQAIRVATRERRQFAVLFLDLDRFKEVNDIHGHDAGDEVLVEVSRRMKAVLRAQDTVCRQGGDEFILLLTEIDHAGADLCARKLLAAMAEPCPLSNGIALRLSVSIGVAMFPDDGPTAQALLKNADSAMYQAKNAGRNDHHFFSLAMARKATHRAALEHAMREALGSTEFSVHYQPKIDLSTGKLAGVEALLRWNSALLGKQKPDAFIPVAEESGLIIPLGTWVMREALRQIRAWQGAGLGWIAVSVNVSAGQFWKQDLPAVVDKLLTETGVPPALLELELTERTALVHPEEGAVIMQRLKAVGVSLSMDDFGTGYSSLSYLSRLPVDILKIDQSFVQRLGHSTGDEVIVRSVVQLARSLELITVAEGVETSQQQDYLRQYGCDLGQGYFYARPLSIPALEGWMTQQQHGSGCPSA